MVEPGSRVLDVGCGDGELLRIARRGTRDVDARGIELSRDGVNDCVAKGLSVIQGDADTDLVDYPTTPSTTSSCRRPCRRRGSRAGAGEHAAHRPARHRLVSEFRPLAHSRQVL
jgi:SAM-dependent methyltransferase